MRPHPEERPLGRVSKDEAAETALICFLTWKAIMSHWRQATTRSDAMRGASEDGAAYITGWSISGLTVLGVLVTVWIFGI
jgi:hypothetical protein